MATQTKKRRPSDLVLREIDREFQTISAVVKNSTGAAITIARDDSYGQPVKKVIADWVFVEAGDEANATAFIVSQFEVEDLADAASTSEELALLVRGPMVIREEGLPDNDVTGSAFTKATLSTAFAALSPPVIAAAQSNPEEEISF